jgi:hypothetical protein
MEALAYAIYDIARTGEIEYNQELVNAVWEYDGNVSENRRTAKARGRMNEMASYRHDYENGYKSFSKRIDRFNKYRYGEKVIFGKGDVFNKQNPFRKWDSLIIPFVYEDNVLPVVVWNDNDRVVDIRHFAANVLEIIDSCSSDSIEDILDKVGREYRYDVKVVIRNIPYDPKDEGMDYKIIRAFEWYDLSKDERDFNPSVDAIDYKELKGQKDHEESEDFE